MSTDETTWANTRRRYSERWDTDPHYVDDQDFGNAFAEHPAAVIAELESVDELYRAGKSHSPWRMAAKRLEKLNRDHTAVSITGDLRTRQAEAWIRNAGVHCDREDEILHELFHAPKALLAGLEQELGPPMLALWRHERPRGEQAETETHERAERWKAARAKARNPAISPSESPSFARAIPDSALSTDKVDFGAEPA